MLRTYKPLLKKFLNFNNIPFDEDTVDSLVDSHPYFLSINSITDTLDEMDVPNYAIEITAETLFIYPYQYWLY